MENSIPNNNSKFSNFEEKLKSYFEARKDIDFAIVFGSYANEKNRPFSDLDIGIHQSQNLSLLQIGNTIYDLKSITNIKIDLLVLNEIYEENSSLAYEIISNHKQIYTHSEKIYVQFKTRTYLHYFDDEPLREMKRNSLQKRIDSNQIGKTNFVN
jgi:predicted nucleotidyltransferase